MSEIHRRRLTVAAIGHKLAADLFPWKSIRPPHFDLRSRHPKAENSDSLIQINPRAAIPIDENPAASLSTSANPTLIGASPSRAKVHKVHPRCKFPAGGCSEQISSRAPGSALLVWPRTSLLIISHGLSTYYGIALSLSPSFSLSFSTLSSASSSFRQPRRLLRTFDVLRSEHERNRRRDSSDAVSLAFYALSAPSLPLSRSDGAKIPSTPAKYSAESNCLYAGGDSRHDTIGPPDRS